MSPVKMRSILVCLVCFLSLPSELDVNGQNAFDFHLDESLFTYVIQIRFQWSICV